MEHEYAGRAKETRSVKSCYEYLNMYGSQMGYLWGCVLLLVAIIFPLAVMGCRSRSVFRRRRLRSPAPFS